jgi:(1->4)-alpha-D-glucan 1-alpha-D-glucosylmutase
VPDIYQGQELWDFSLVDPDNRRPVDFDLRSRALTDLFSRAESEGMGELCQELLRNYRDGGTKLWVTMRALNFRRDHPNLFQQGNYLPLQAMHGREEHVVAFARVHESEVAIVAAPRLSYTMMKGREEPPLGAAWGDSELPLPPPAVGKRLRNIFTGEVLTAGSSISCRELFARFPVALLTLS